MLLICFEELLTKVIDDEIKRTVNISLQTFLAQSYFFYIDVHYWLIIVTSHLFL